MSLEQQVRQFLKKSPPLVALVKRMRATRREFELATAKMRVRRRDGYLLSVYGVWMRDRWDDATLRYCIQGAYGSFYADWLREQEDCILLDIGANMGLYSLIACTNPGIRAVYAFEPVPETFQYLVDNLERNAADRCTACPVGISLAAEKLSIWTKTGHSGASTLRGDRLGQVGFDSQTTVQVVGPDYLDDLVDTSLASRIVAKIDVEGYEPIVIDALRRSTIWPKVSTIYLEVNERYLDVRPVLSGLQADGFEVIKQNGSGLMYDLMVQRSLLEADT
jgi:FkbM family methyltransferase